MAGVALRRGGTVWEDWLPSRVHWLFDKFKTQEVVYLVDEYSGQKQLLEKLYEQRNLDRFVATYNGIKNQEGEAFSYCVWSKDVETLLPKTDRVWFYEDGKGAAAEASWESVERVMGPLIVAQEDLYPARYLVTEYPSPEMLARLKD